MAKHHEVLSYLRPQGGYISNGETFEAINFVDCAPFTKEEYEATFDLVDDAKAQAEATKAEAKAAAEAKLAALGLTTDDLAALGLQHNL